MTTIECNAEEILQRISKGGYPEALQRTKQERLEAWFNSYLSTIIQRDIRELARINGLTILPNLLSLLAARSTSLFYFSDFSRITGIPQSTLKRYLSLFEMTFHLLKVRACGALDFFTNTLSSLTKKIGIPAAALPIAFMRPLSGSGSIGVMTEIMKHYGVDSLYGFIALTMFGSMETTF